MSVSFDFTGSNTLKDSVSRLVDSVKYLVKPQGTGINGFIFDVLGSEEISLDSLITDHYVENNYSYQDHIALKPERFTVHGYVGELVDLFPSTALSFVNKALSLNTIASFVPSFTAGAAQKYAKIAGKVSKASEVINQAKNVYDMFLQNDSETKKQRSAFSYFYGLQQSRQLCTVETPWAVFTDMAVESVRFRQEEQSRMVTDVIVTFKKIRIVDFEQNVISAIRQIETAANRFLAGSSSTNLKGQITGDELPQTALNSF